MSTFPEPHTGIASTVEAASTSQQRGWQTASRTASAIAHELNQPIAAISAYAESLHALAATLPSLPDAGHRALQGIVMQSQRAGLLLRELLEFLHLGDACYTAVDVNQLVEDCLSDGDEAQGWGAQTDVLLAPGLAMVLGSALQIRKILLHLLHNAREAMHASGMPEDGMRLLVRTAACADSVEITVEDNGPGLDAQAAERLFTPFFTTKSSGAGLGLAISRSLAEGLGGTLVAESRPGSGALLRLRLPAVPNTGAT